MAGYPSWPLEEQGEQEHPPPNYLDCKQAPPNDADCYAQQKEKYEQYIQGNEFLTIPEALDGGGFAESKNKVKNAGRAV